jgi:hypothetical protein
LMGQDDSNYFLLKMSAFILVRYLCF